jgi:hypothetical protein
MVNYLFWSGVVLNVAVALFALLFTWVWVVWPAIEAISLTRMTRAVCKRNGDKFRPFRTFRIWYGDTFFGRGFSAVRGDYWYWEGVGKWEVLDYDAEV